MWLASRLILKVFFPFQLTRKAAIEDNNNLQQMDGCWQKLQFPSCLQHYWNDTLCFIREMYSLRSDSSYKKT